MNTFQDKQLVCKDCGNEFVWTAGEQEFYAQKGFENAPIRCPDCRNKKKQQSRDGRSFGPSQSYTIICSDCGKEGTVPFKPSNPDKPVYCKDCFDKRHNARKTA